MSLSKQITNTLYNFQHTNIVWRNVVLMIVLHLLGFYGLFLRFTTNMSIYTKLSAYFFIHLGGLSVTAGRHRYFAHKSYKGTKLLDYLLVFMSCCLYQQSIITWCRDHRLHHKFSDTDADPYNSKRGFFFSHMGWMMVRKHAEVKTKGKTIDITDLKSNPVVMFEYRYSVPLALVFTFFMPTFLPWFFWNESLSASFFYCSMYRYLLCLHVTWTVNSFAHMFGMRPYDAKMPPTENLLVSTLSLGEGYHNYHHAFSWDYKAGEFSNNFGNLTTFFIDFLAFLNLVTERKTASAEMIAKRVSRTGERSKLGVRDNLKSIINYVLFVFILI